MTVTLRLPVLRFLAGCSPLAGAEPVANRAGGALVDSRGACAGEPVSPGPAAEPAGDALGDAPGRVG